MERAVPLRSKVSVMYARVLRRCVDLRLGRVGVQVDTLEVEDVILGVIAVVERVVACFVSKLKYAA
jgi:hypothetical protein